MTLAHAWARRLVRPLLPALLPLLAPLLFGGCALLRPDPAPDRAAAGSAVAAGVPAVRVQIEAPAAIKTVLDRHLDLTRLGALTRGDAVSDNEWSRLADAAPAQVRELLQTEGYFAPMVVAVRDNVRLPDQPQEVTLRVTPGPRAEISRVTIEFEGELSRQADAGDVHASALREGLRKGFLLPAGAPFRNADWSDAKATLLARLRAAGYATASWNGTAADVDVPNHRVRLFLVADSGPLFRSGAIEISGLQVHEAETVRALANFGVGTPLTEGLLLDYQDRLLKSGLFESVTVTHDGDPAQAAAAGVNVLLREQTLQVYTVGIGYSANNGPRTTVEHLHRRLLGYPLRSRSKLELGGAKRSLDLEVSTHTRAGLFRNVTGLAIERLVTDTDVVLSQRLRLGRARDIQAAEQFVFAEAERGERRTAVSRVATIALSGNGHLVLRDLDSVVLPTSGYTLAVQGGLGLSRGDSAISGVFSRAYARLTYYRPLGGSWYGQTRVEAGQVFRKHGVAAPDSQLFRAGGDDSVRGYAYRDLGPIENGIVTSGAALLTGSIELARPFSVETPSLWGALFIDAGRAATRFKELDPAIGYGVGLRWRSPVGPLRVDWAWAQELRRGRLHLSIGIAL